MEQDGRGEKAGDQFSGAAVSVEEVGDGVNGSQKSATQVAIVSIKIQDRTSCKHRPLLPTQGSLSCQPFVEAMASH